MSSTADRRSLLWDLAQIADEMIGVAGTDSVIPNDWFYRWAKVAKEARALLKEEEAGPPVPVASPPRRGRPRGSRNKNIPIAMPQWFRQTAGAP
jgi:hypothetical protein